MNRFLHELMKALSNEIIVKFLWRDIGWLCHRAPFSSLLVLVMEACRHLYHLRSLRSAPSRCQRLCVSAPKTVFWQHCYKTGPRGPTLPCRGWCNQNCTVRCKHRLSIKTSSPQPQTRGSAPWSGRNRHWREPRPEETSAFPWANPDPKKQLHSACTMDLTPQTNLYNLIVSNHIHGTRLTG